MQDLRKMIPRTPPEGLRDWTLHVCADELGRSGLIYEAEYVEDREMLLMAMDEWYKPRKVKMVRVTCSCCGSSILLHWCKDGRCGYGFVYQDDEEGDWARIAIISGDETRCPICGQKVLVKKRAEIRDYYVTAECHVMSASLVGEENMLALTGWDVQRRVCKFGIEILEFIPAEAYVFSANECAQLRGWNKSYSGTVGYFVSYSDSWRQPKIWSERWGMEERIFGLTPELIEASCLPHCKLYEYMSPRAGAKHYPILYLRLYQEHPNVEHLLMHGLPRVLDDLIVEGDEKGERLTPKGWISITEIEWNERRPAQMLHLTKEELRMLKSENSGAKLWRLFLRTKETGEVLTSEDIHNAFSLDDEQVLELVGQGPVSKSIRYLLRQFEMQGVEDENEDPDPYGIPDVQTLTDYWTMAGELGRDLNDPAVRFPRDLIEAHDNMTALIMQRKEAAAATKFRLRRKLLSRYNFKSDGLLIRPAASQAELTREGDILHHCVSTYGTRYAEGKTAIFFIRKVSKPFEPYYTLELDEKNITVRQNRGSRNCARTPEVQAFEDLWLSWLKMGAPRDWRGKPVLQQQEVRMSG